MSLVDMGLMTCYDAAIEKEALCSNRSSEIPKDASATGMRGLLLSLMIPAHHIISHIFLISPESNSFAALALSTESNDVLLLALSSIL